MAVYCRIAKKVSHYLGDVLEDDRDKLLDNLQANGCKLHNLLAILTVAVIVSIYYYHNSSEIILV